MNETVKSMNSPTVTIAEVVGITVREQSTVTGRGGGGSINSGSGFILPVRINTVHTTHTELWVKFENGIEDRFDFTNVDLPVRQGHRIALLVHDKSIWAVKNFNTSTTLWLVDAQSLSGPINSGGCLPMIGYFLAIYIVGGMAVPILAGLVSLLFHPTSSDSTPPFGVALLFGYVLMLITAGVFAPLLVSRTAKKKNRAREAVVLYWQAVVARGVQELERAKPRMTDDGTPPPLSARS